MAASTTNVPNDIRPRQVRAGCGTRNRRVWGLVTATLGAALVWLAATGPLGVTLTVAGGDRVLLTSVTGVALLAGVLGWVVVSLLERCTRRPRGIWLGIAGAVLLVSLLGPTAATSAAAMVTLALLHLVVGVTLLVTLAPRYRG